MLEKLPDIINPVHPEQWGKDHNDLMMYLESTCVDLGGTINNQKMRSDLRIHPEFLNRGNQHMNKRLPTRLKDGLKEDHDDWSCLDDLNTFGYVEAFRDFAAHVPLIYVQITDSGWELAGRLRRERAERNSVMRSNAGHRLEEA